MVYIEISGHANETLIFRKSHKSIAWSYILHNCLKKLKFEIGVDTFSGKYALCFKWATVHILFGLNLGQGIALVQCTLETKPLELAADYAVTLKVEPIEAIYDSVSYL